MIAFWFEQFRSVFKKETPGIPRLDEFYANILTEDQMVWRFTSSYMWLILNW